MKEFKSEDDFKLACRSLLRRSGKSTEVIMTVYREYVAKFFPKYKAPEVKTKEIEDATEEQ